MPLEFNKKYTLGKRTFWFLFLKNGKIATLLILLLVAGAISLYVGHTGEWVDTFLATHWNGIIPKILVLEWIGLLIISLIIILFVGMFEYFAQHRFILDENSFHIRKGIFMIKEKVIPYRHIQNVDIEQPYHYRIFGVARLNITTGAASDTFAQDKHNKNQGDLIPIIDKKRAKELAQILIRKGGEQESRPEPTAV